MDHDDDALRGYRTPSRLLHWITALLVLATIPAGLTMVQEGLARPVQDTLFIFHKNVGVVILLLVLTRLAVRSVYPPPPLPATVPEWQRRAADASHTLLYSLLIVMPVSGYIRVRAGGFPIDAPYAMGAPHLTPRSNWPEETAIQIHATARILLIQLILMHVGAALHHLLIRRDGVFGRMWPPYRRQRRGGPSGQK
jgi:cytochrome b561